MADDPERAAQMGRAGRERVKRAFGLEKHVAAMLELYARAQASKDSSGEMRRMPGPRPLS